MTTTPQPVVIIRRRSKRHAGHHGGAWKVAYADFVTAMMSLFMVLWLLNSSEQVKKAVGGYFTDPKGHGKDVGNGVRANGNGNLAINKDDMSKLKEKLAQAVKQDPELQKLRDNVVISVTSEGLRIELIEGQGSLFFESGSPAPTEAGKDLLAKLATEIGKLPNKVAIEGHTDSQPFTGRPGYSNWELSADRANAARRLMQSLGMRENQVTQVRGYADQSPSNPADPSDPANRRVTLIVQNQDAAPSGAPKPAEPSKEASKQTAIRTANSPQEAPQGVVSRLKNFL